MKLKKIHFVILITGIVFNCVSIFHLNLWFDECFSVAIASKSFYEIWKIAGTDVHPVLYYWVLHIIYLVTKGNVLGYRVFSFICISILGILGYTHIRKDFGEKTGVIFTFFSYFLPTICTFTSQIRMYSMSIVSVTILAIYANRLLKEENDIFKNWLIFGITSLMSIYTHYYGLVVAGIINLLLLIYLIKKKRKASSIKILILGIIQFVLYIPWIIYFFKQLKFVAKGFWIGFEFPKTLMELTSFQFIGNINYTVGFIFSIIVYIYLGIKVKNVIRNKEEYKIGMYALLIYISVICVALCITIIMLTSILYYRYLFVITGLYIFFISYFLAKEKNKYYIYSICIMTLILSIWSNYRQLVNVYDINNMTQITYLKENMQSEDIIIYDETNIGTGSVISLNFKENKQYCYNPSNWKVEEAYKVFSNNLNVCITTDFLSECNNRIWIIDNENKDLYNEFFNNQNYVIESQKLIKTKYENYTYNLILVRKISI